MIKDNGFKLTTLALALTASSAAVAVDTTVPALIKQNPSEGQLQQAKQFHNTTNGGTKNPNPEEKKKLPVLGETDWLELLRKVEAKKKQEEEKKREEKKTGTTVNPGTTVHPDTTVNSGTTVTTPKGRPNQIRRPNPFTEVISKQQKIEQSLDRKILHYTEHDLVITVNSHDRPNNGFWILNGGTTDKFVTFRTTADLSYFKTREGNGLVLDDMGVHLTDLQIKGLADGTDDEHAVNLKQLKKVSNEVDRLSLGLTFLQESLKVKPGTNDQSDTSGNGGKSDDVKPGTDGNGGKSGDVKPGDVKPGTDGKSGNYGKINKEIQDRIDGDKATLAAANNYTNQSIAKLEKNYQAAIASSIAIASLPQPTEAGMSMVSLATGSWSGQQGYALGVSGVSLNNKWVYKAAATADSRGKFGGGLSVGYQW